LSAKIDKLAAQVNQFNIVKTIKLIKETEIIAETFDTKKKELEEKLLIIKKLVGKTNKILMESINRSLSLVKEVFSINIQINK